MERDEGWIGDFYARHTERHPREDWYVPGSDAEGVFLDGWEHAFSERSLGPRELELASLDMVADPPRFLADHAPALIRLALARRLRNADRVAPPAPPEEEDTPERAEALAKLKALYGSLAASRRARAPFVPSRPREPQEWQARAVPGRPYLADAPEDDPVLARERGVEAKPVPARPEDIRIPEDDLEPLF